MSDPLAIPDHIMAVFNARFDKVRKCDHKKVAYTIEEDRVVARCACGIGMAITETQELPDGDD